MSIDTELSGRLGIRDGVNARVLSKNEENHTIQNTLLRKNTSSNFLHNKKSEGANKKKKKFKKMQKYEKKQHFLYKRPNKG